MRDKHQKKLQKDINKVVKAMNENVYNDNLWLGRFYGHQIKADYYKFEDGSGGILTTWIELVDRKTNLTKVIKLSHHGGVINFVSYDMWMAMNTFITEDCAVWEKEDPRHDIIDYRGGVKNVKRK
ncbi:MAG: hypothetical protein LIO71_03545 [Ruminococcus sp.]|nr:hypothetical protein [Ruminococcus sp.]